MLLVLLKNIFFFYFRAINCYLHSFLCLNINYWFFISNYTLKFIKLNFINYFRRKFELSN